MEARSVSIEFWPACKVSISSSRRVVQLSFLFHSISLSIEKVILIWILPSFWRPQWLSRHFPAKPRRVRRRVRYHSLRLFEGYNFRFCLAWFRWVLTKLWPFKVGVKFRPKFWFFLPLGESHIAHARKWASHFSYKSHTPLLRYPKLVWSLGHYQVKYVLSLLNIFKYFFNKILWYYR